MKITISLLTYFISISILTSQNYTLVTGLDSAVEETSGLLYLNNTLITNNDSGNTNQLFDINTSDGTIARTITIPNASNIDWEDLAYDDNYIYIAEIGNNLGSRTDLKIYRISRSDYFNNTSVIAEIINYSYSDQTDFTPSPFATNFDAEALIHLNNKLYIFTKNWIDAKTNIYELSKTPGTYTAILIDTIDSQGLITGASYNNTNGNIMLCGYDGLGSFLLQLSGFSNGIFSNGTLLKTAITPPTNYSQQTEGIASLNTDEYYVSAEKVSSDLHGLYSFNVSTLTDSEMSNNQISFYPNPAKTELMINKEDCTTKIYTLTGELILTTSNSKINISDLSKGVYLIKIKDSYNGYLIKRLVID
ncbi:T9SS type A sorting domain-containing protein [Winogradskyella sp. A2]|uniref:T9SS type A sorting domain-containing protein n=1 Tax=Winogradskyella sp. A2 TaxID=3366944 RepID=UPI00398C33C5